MTNERSNRDSRKREHIAFMLPVIGWLLIVPPLLTLFGVHSWLFGAPLQTVYLFAVWLTMIAGALVLSRLMPGTQDVENPGALEDGDTADR